MEINKENFVAMFHLVLIVNLNKKVLAFYVFSLSHHTLIFEVSTVFTPPFYNITSLTVEIQDKINAQNVRK